MSFRNLGSLSARQWVVLPQLVVMAMAITIGLRIASFAVLVQEASRASRSALFGWIPAFQNGCSISELARVTWIASRVSFRNRCLVRSLVLFWLISARREPAEIVLGAAKQGSQFLAHAWTLSNSGPVGEDARTLEQFAVLAKYGNGLKM